jgi:mono/diheme cytochrome c family protein
MVESRTGETRDANVRQDYKAAFERNLMISRRIGGALCALLSVTAMAAIAAAGDLPLERGRAIATAKCARCHAIGTEGPSPVALAPPFRLLPQRYPVDHLAEALAEGIVVGHPMMPEFAFDPPEIDALLSYIGSLSRAQGR